MASSILSPGILYVWLMQQRKSRGLRESGNVDSDRISYDKLGIGRDFHNHLVRRGLGDAIGYAGSGRPQDRKAFTNLRTEAAWKLQRPAEPDWALDPTAPLASRPASLPHPAAASGSRSSARTWRP